MVLIQHRDEASVVFGTAPFQGTNKKRDALGDDPPALNPSEISADGYDPT